MTTILASHNIKTIKQLYSVWPHAMLPWFCRVVNVLMFIGVLWPFIIFVYSLFKENYSTLSNLQKKRFFIWPSSKQQTVCLKVNHCHYCVLDILPTDGPVLRNRCTNQFFRCLSIVTIKGWMIGEYIAIYYKLISSLSFSSYPFLNKLSINDYTL